MAELSQPILVEVRWAVPAVRGVSFRVAEGEIVGLIGPNGAGKSTTLHAITGLVLTHAGHIRVVRGNGRRPQAGADRAVRRFARAGGAPIYADFTVEENLGLGLAARRGRGALAEAYELFPMLQEFRRRSAGAPPAGSSSSSRSPAAWSQSRGSSCSTSRPSAWAPPSWPRSSRRSPASGSRA